MARSPVWYEGAAGKGAYNGRIASPSEFTVEWSGALELGRTDSR
jgi:hypothetical protein